MALTDEQLIDIARKLRLAGREVKNRRDGNAVIVGLTSSQADALLYILSNPGCRIADLCKGVGTSHQAACGYADRLFDAGLIRVEQSRSDARARLLHPTELGKEVYSKFINLGVEVNSNLFSPLTDDEIQELGRILDKIISG